MENQYFFESTLYKNDFKFAVSAIFDHMPTTVWSIAPRVIQDNMLVMVRGGEGYYEINGCRHLVRPGRVFLISHDVPHSAWQDKNNPVSVIAVRFSLKESGSEDECFPKYSFVYDPGSTNILFGILTELCKHIARYTLAHTDLSICDGLMRSFFYMLHSDCCFYSDIEPYEGLMEKVGCLIDNSLRTGPPVSLADMLEQTKISHYEFSARFQKHFKMSFRRYVFEKRLVYAQELLQTTDLSVKQIAFTVGYSDPYIFSNQFKAVYGVAPKVYRCQRR